MHEDDRRLDWSAQWSLLINEKQQNNTKNYSIRAIFIFRNLGEGGRVKTLPLIEINFSDKTNLKKRSALQATGNTFFMQYLQNIYTILCLQSSEYEGAFHGF